MNTHFRVEDKVRVKSGVRDPDFADIPIGGWAGTVQKSRQNKGEIVYLIAWGRSTLQAMHPVYYPGLKVAH